MAGIGKRRVTPFAQMEDEYGMTAPPIAHGAAQVTGAAPQKSVSDLFNLEEDPYGYSGSDRAQMFFGSLRDVVESIDGNRTDYGTQAQQNVDANRKRTQNSRLRNAIKAGMKPDGSVDWTAVQQAIIANSDDPNAIVNAFKIGQPDYKYDDGMVVKTPFGGGMPEVTPVQGYRPKAPSGYTWAGDGMLSAIPGGPGDPRVAGTLASARRKPSGGGGGGVPGLGAGWRIKQ